MLLFSTITGQALGVFLGPVLSSVHKVGLLHSLRTARFNAILSPMWGWGAVCVWGGGGGPQRGTVVNILSENGQYPHNSSYEAPCVPRGVTGEVDESWQISAVEYIAIDNTPLRDGIHVDGSSRLARRDQSAGHAKLKN